MSKYIAKNGTWFVAGTECILIDDYRPQMNSGLFSGRCVRDWEEDGNFYTGIQPDGVDEEVCGFDEFDIIKDENED